MNKIFLCIHLKYSTSNRDGAGRIVIWVVVIITQKTPALSHFITTDIFSSEPPLYSDSNRPNAFNILIFSQLGSPYNIYPASHQGYVEALTTQ